METMDYIGASVSEKAASPCRQGEIHFLHLGKCAGTQISFIAEQLDVANLGPKIIRHGHHVLLKDIPQTASYFFSVRDPLARFVSGFYSRKRKGRPRYNVEWTEYETRAFARFEHANELAESLFGCGTAGSEAVAAIKSIGHIARNQIDWFSGCGAFLEVRPPLWIIRQDNFESDLYRFLERIQIENPWEKILISKDKTVSHANDYSLALPLSQKAKDNLRRWYCQDLEFYAMCCAWLEGANRLRINK